MESVPQSAGNSWLAGTAARAACWFKAEKYHTCLAMRLGESLHGVVLGGMHYAGFNRSVFLVSTSSVAACDALWRVEYSRKEVSKTLSVHVCL